MVAAGKTLNKTLMENDEKSGKSVWELLHNYFDSQPGYWEEKKGKETRKENFLDELMDYFPCRERAHLEEVLGPQTIIVNKERKTAKHFHRYNAVRLLVGRFGIPAHVFDVPSKYLLPKQEIVGARVAFLNMNNKDEDRETIKKYVDINNFSILAAKKSIKIHDYLGRDSVRYPESTMPLYFEAHEKNIFPTLVKQLKSKKPPRYVRVVALPLRLMELSGPRFTTEGMSAENVAALVLRHCSAALFNHICECLALFDNDKRGDAFVPVFSASHIPSRTYQFSLIEAENTKYLYTEYYRLNSNRHAKNSFLTLNDVNLDKEMGEIFGIYENEIKSLSQPPANFRFRKDNMEGVFRHTLKIYEKDIQNSKDYKEELRGIANRKVVSINKHLKMSFGAIMPTPK